MPITMFTSYGIRLLEFTNDYIIGANYDGYRKKYF